MNKTGKHCVFLDYVPGEKVSCKLTGRDLIVNRVTIDAHGPLYEVIYRTESGYDVFNIYSHMLQK